LLKDFTLAAGKRLSLYSREGTKLYSSQHDIDIQVQGGNVEIGGPGRLLIKNSGIRKAGSGSMQGVMKSFEPSTFDEKFIIRNALTKEPIPGKAVQNNYARWFRCLRYYRCFWSNVTQFF